MAKFILRPQHPTGTYRRGGYGFNSQTPTEVEGWDVTDLILKDPWLMKVEEENADGRAAEVGANEAPEGPEDHQQESPVQQSSAESDPQESPAEETPRTKARRRKG